MQNLNNKSLNLKTMQQGGEPSPEMQGDQVSQIEQLLEQIRLEIDRGGKPQEIIVQLLEGGMPPDTVAQIFVKLGMPEDQLGPLMEQAMSAIQSQGQPEEQPQGQPSQEQMIANQGMPMAQDGTETDGNYEESLAYIGDMGEDTPQYEPQEDIVTKNGWDYKRIYDPTSGEATYYTKSTNGKKWKDLQNGKNNRALTSIKATVFKDVPIEDWENHPEKADWDNQMKTLKKKKDEAEAFAKIDEYKQGLRSKAQATLSSANIDYSKYGVKVVQYPYGGMYGGNIMPPGHIEAQLYDKKTKKLVTDLGKDEDGNAIISYVNRWNIDALNAPLKSTNWKVKNKKGKWENRKDVRISDLELDAAGIQRFITEAQIFTGTDSSNLEDAVGRDFALAFQGKDKNGNIIDSPYNDLFNITRSTSLGTGKKGAYDAASSNCADGVCSALGLDDSKYINAGMTDPTEVMDAIRILPQFNQAGKFKHVGTKVSAEQGIGKLIKNATSDKNGEGGYDITNKSKKTISHYLDNMPEGTAENLGFNLAKIYNDYSKNSKAYAAKDKAFDNVKKDYSVFSTPYWLATGADLANKGKYLSDIIGGGIDAWNAIPDNTIPTAINVGVNEAVDYVGKEADAYLRGEQGWIPDALQWWEQGGELPTAQYGNRGRYGDVTSMYGSYNQWENQNDKSYRAPIQSAYMPMNLGARGTAPGFISTLAEGYGRMFGKKDTDGDGLMDGAFRDNKAKKNRHKERRAYDKATEFDYKVTVDPNDPNNYSGASATDLYDATNKKDPTSLSTSMNKYNADNVRAKYDPTTNKYNVGYMDPKSMSKNKNLHWGKSIADFGKDYGNLSSADQQTALDLSNTNLNDAPAGTTVGLDEQGRGLSYAPGYQTDQNKERTQKLMMMNKFGGERRLRKAQKGNGDGVKYTYNGDNNTYEFVDGNGEVQVFNAPIDKSSWEGTPDYNPYGVDLQASLSAEAIKKIQEAAKDRSTEKMGYAYNDSDNTYEFYDQDGIRQVINAPRDRSYMEEPNDYNPYGVPLRQEGGEQEQQQLIQQVSQALQQGAKPEEVLKQLVQMGLPQEQAVQIIQAVIQQLQGGQGGPPQQAPTQAPQQAPPGMAYGGERYSDQLMRAQAGMETNAAQFAAEQDAFAAAQGDTTQQSIEQQGVQQQTNQSNDMFEQVVNALSQGAKPEQMYQQLMQMGMDDSQAGKLIQDAILMLKGNMQNQAKVNENGNLSTSFEDSDPYGDMLQQLEQQKDSLRNQYRKDVKQLDLNQSKKNKKRGGQTDSVELTTKQIAQIMAAGGSVKYV